MSERNTLRIAVRKLDAFEGALKKQSVEFSRLEKTTFNLDITPLNIQDLHTALFKKKGLKTLSLDINMLDEKENYMKMLLITIQKDVVIVLINQESGVISNKNNIHLINIHLQVQ